MAGAMTQGKEWKHILLFTLPIMAGNLLQQMYNIVDGIIVGNFVGQSALSAVGTCTPLTLLFLALAIGMSNGCAILIAQYFGAKRWTELRRGVSTSIIMLVALGAVVSVAGLALSWPLLAVVMGVPGTALDFALIYFRIYSVGLLFQFAYNIAAAILRAVGDSKATLYFLLVSAAANVVLDLLFVAVLDWSVAGAAVATVISQALSAGVSLVYMFRRHEILRFTRAQFTFHRATGLLALKLGVPTALQQCVVSCGHIAIQRVVNSFGDNLMAAFTAGLRLDQIIMVPIQGFNVGMATFTGQNMGAGRLDRVPRGYRATQLMSCGVCIVLSVLSWIFADPLVSIFGVEGAPHAMGVEYVRFAAPFFLLCALYRNTGAILQGSGDVVAAACITLGSLGIRAGATYVLAYLTPVGYAAAWTSLPIGWSLALVAAYLRYKFGPWKKKGIVKNTGGPVGLTE